MNGIGIDIIEVERFGKFRSDKDDFFLEKNFTKKEREYCFSFKDASPHLAGTFAAKEAIYKALGGKGVALPLIEIRRHAKNGQPLVWVRGKKDASLLLSISHTKDTAVAVAVKVII